MPEASAGAARPKARLDYVDGLRALAALVVFVNHAYAQIYNRVYTPAPSFRWARWSLVAGHLSVTVFIVISGFCLALPVIDQGGTLRGGLAGFLKRRARRILPPYYAAVVLCLLLIATVIGKPTGTLWDVPILVQPISVLAHVLLLQDLFATSHINYVFWSIAVEWQIYLVMPLLVWAWRRFGLATVVIGALVVGYALRFGFEETRLARAHPQFLGMFAFGMLAASIVRGSEAKLVALRERVPWTAVALVLMLGLAVLIHAWGVDVSVDRFHYLDLPVGLLALVLLVAASNQSGFFGRIFEFRPLVAIGTFSYSLYLIHAPLLQLTWQYGVRPFVQTPEKQFVCLMSGGFAIVLGAAYLFFLAFEAPFMGAAHAVRAKQKAPVVS